MPLTGTTGSNHADRLPEASMRWFDYFIDDLGPEPHAALTAIVPAALAWIRQTESVESVLVALEAAKDYETILIKKYHRYSLRTPATILRRHLERRLGQFILQERIYPVYANHPAPKDSPSFLAGGSSSYRMKIMAQASYKDFEEALAVALQDPKRPGSRTLVADYLAGKAQAQIKKSPQEARAAWHRGKRQVDSTRIIQGLSGQLVAAVAGLDLVAPDEVDKEAVREDLDSIRDSMRSLKTYLEKWSKRL